MKRLIALLLAMIMILGSVPTQALVAAAEELGGDSGVVQTDPTTVPTTAPETQATEPPATQPPVTEAPTTVPTTQATEAPTTEATSAPTTQPTTEATTEATSAPTMQPTTEATTEATTESTTESTTEITTDETSSETTEETSSETTEAEPAPSVAIDSRFTLGSHELHITAAEGVFPGGTTVNAKLHQSFEIGDILSSAVSNLELFAAFDLQAAGEDGAAVQPNGTVYVDIHTPDTLFGMEGATIRVYYVNIADRTAMQIPCLVDFETGTVSFTTDHFSIYAITVSDVPECICETQCDAEAPNGECPVCSSNAELCWGMPTVLSIEELAALFAALPHCSTITAGTTEKEKEAIFAKLDEAMNAYYALMDADFETCSLFEKQYEALLRNALLLNDALTGNNWIAYDTTYHVEYVPGDWRNATITLSEDMVDEPPMVVRYINGVPRLYQVVKLTTAERTYAFTRADNDYWESYTITAASNAGARHQRHIYFGNNAVITFSPISTGSSTHTFKIFYVYSNVIPTLYYTGGTTANLYGPSGDNTPMVNLTVNTDALRNSSNVTIGTTYSNIYWYIVPNLDEGGNVSTANAKAFWADVQTNLNDASRTALYNTGLADSFVGYILKSEGDHFHGDGILSEADTPYVAELHEVKNGATVYFGSVVGTDKRYSDVLALCDQNLGGTVNWDVTNPTGTSIGYFYETKGNTQRVIKVQVTQMDTAPAGGFIKPGDSDIRYTRMNNGSHYLARYQMETTEVSNTTTIPVTYTDGGAGVFADITYPYVVSSNNQNPTFPVFNGSTNREGYTFRGWLCSTDGKIYTDVSGIKVNKNTTKEITLTAQWDADLYTILWKDKDGTILEKDEEVLYGAIPTYDGTLPGNKVQEGYDEVFIGWTPAVTRVSGDHTQPIVYTAAYRQVPHQYNIVWKNYDGTILETDEDVNYGTTPTYDGAKPERAEDAQHTYTFSGWSPEVIPVNGYREYVAQYEPTLRTYTITWVDDNGKVLETDLNVPYGTAPRYDQGTPTKEATAEFTYTFKGWSPVIATVTGDATYQAEFTATRRSYTVTWKHEDGTVLDTGTFEYGQMPTYKGALPTKAATTQYTYTFNGWTPQVQSVTGNAEYVASFSETVNQYTVTWNYQSSQLQEVDQNVPYGTPLSFDNWDKLDYQSASYIYTFTGWKLEKDATDTLYKTPEDVQKLTVNGDMILNAQYTFEKKGYDITVKVIVDAILEDGNYKDGTQVSLQDVLAGEHQMFLKDTEGTSSYELVQNSQTLDYVARLVPNGNYQLYMGDDTTPYSPYVLAVDGMDRERNLYFYTVTYDADGGSMSPTVTYHRGRAEVSNTVPVKEGHNFLGWQVEGTNQILKAADLLDADIQRPYTLKALWGNVRVDVEVTIKHAVFKTDGSLLGRDKYPGQLEIELAHRTPVVSQGSDNPVQNNAPYVEVVGVPTEYRSAQTATFDVAPYESVIRVENVYVGLDNRYEYSATAVLPGYQVVSRTTEPVEGSANHYVVKITLQYNPELFNLSYTVQADSTMPESMIPEAVDVKLLYESSTGWNTISAHDHSSVDVEIDSSTRSGFGSYPVPVFNADTSTRYYRVAAVGFTLPDGSGEISLTATGSTGDNSWVFTSGAADGKYSAGAYTAVLTFNAENNAHHGAHGAARTDNDGNVVYDDNGNIIYDQHGTLRMMVYAHPGDITLNLNYQTDDPVFDTIEDVFVVPDLTGYVPTRTGYTFAGWYHDAQCTDDVVAGDFLNLGANAENVLYAKWNEDITVEGLVTVANFYKDEDDNVHELYDHNLLSHVTVRVLNAQGLQIASLPVTINYPKDDDGKVNGPGSATYQIEGIPNNNEKFYVDILQSTASYYTAVYQNETNPAGEVDNLSLNCQNQYDTYKDNRNRVAKGTTDPQIATVNAYLRFVPETYDLYYTIDAGSIGAAYRPDLAHVMIFADSNPAEGFAWNIIAQMRNGDQVNAQATEIKENMAPVSYKVWRTFGDGTVYNYAVGPYKIRYYPDGDGVAVTTEAGSDYALPDTLPFAVSYDPGYTFYDAHGNYGTQYKLLKIVLTPKEYPVTYMVNGGTMPQDYPKVHTWSIATDLSSVNPERVGYTFDGWYADAALTQQVKAIDAKVRSNTTLYAKWNQNTYTIGYELQGGTEPGNPTSYSIETETFVLKAPTREGYTFEGWTGSGLSAMTKNVVITRGSTGDRSYTAHWERNRYAITVTVENGTATPAGNHTVLHGEDLTIYFNPKSASYVVDTVMLDGKPADLADDGSFAFTDVKAAHTIKVVFSEDSNGDHIPDRHQAQVTYEVQNGTFAESANNSANNRLRVYYIDLEKKNDQGEWVTISPAPKLGNTERYGNTIPTLAEGDMVPVAGYHDHGHWRATPEPEMDVVNGAHYLFHFDQRITYYIQYYPTGKLVNPQYTNGIYHGTDIVIDPNLGKWTFTWADDTTQTYGGEHPFQLTQNMSLGTAQRDYYVFDGWDHSTEHETAAHVYTAKWVPEQYSITYHMPYGFLEGSNPDQYTVQTPTFTLKNPRRDGYTFQGWQDKDTGAISDNVVIEQGSHGDREFTAVWQPNSDTSYTVRYYFEVLNPAEGEAKYREDVNKRVNRTGTTDTEVNLQDGDMPAIMDHFKRNDVLTITSGKIAGTGQLILAVYYDLNQYTVTWKNYDGTLLEEDTVKHGDLPSFDQADPTKQGDAQYSYTFTGWDKAIDQPITGTTVFTAQYQQTINKYTITWLNEDQTVLGTDEVEYGVMPEYKGETPIKAPSARHEYTFKEWSPTVETVTGNASYTAIYSESDRLYTATVQFNVNGAAATADDMANSLGTRQLYLVSMSDATNVVPLPAVVDSDGLYMAKVRVDNYRVYVGTETQKTCISDDIILSIVNTAASVQVSYYTVRYYAGYTDGDSAGNGALLKTEYLLKGSHADVNYEPNPSRGQAGEWYFKGWDLVPESSEAVDGTDHTGSAGRTGGSHLQHQDHLTDSITAPIELVAKWSNVKVNLTITIHHGNDTSTDERKLDIHLAYKAKDTDEDYVEVVGSGVKVEFTSAGKDATTTVTYNDYTGLSDDFHYSNTVSLHNYVVTERTVSVDTTNNTYNVAITLKYKPDIFALEYSVNATGIGTDATTGWLVPKAVDIKVVQYTTNNGVPGWHPIAAMEGITREVALGTEKTGTGSYEVPQTGENSTDLIPYWVDAIGLTVHDAHGNEIEMTTTATNTSTGDWTWRSNEVPGRYPLGAYTVSSANPDTTGARYNAETEKQDRQIELQVQVHPATIILDPGYANGAVEKLSNLFTMPSLEDYIPTQPGYTFRGWALKAEDGTTTPFNEKTGTLLQADTTYYLVAQWAQNLTIYGTLTASNMYDGEKLIEGDRIKAATVFLYKENVRGQVGTPITVAMTPVDADDPNRSGTYQFENVPNDNSTYYIEVSAPGFEIQYSRGLPEGVQSNLKDNYAVFPENVYAAQIDANLEFKPQNFNLYYEVDVHDLGKDFWPVGTTVLVMGDTDHSGAYAWETVIQMSNGGKPITINPTDGIGIDCYEVWQYHSSGFPYNYAIRLEYLPLDLNGDGAIDARRENLSQGIDGRPNNLPIEVKYDYPAYYMAIAPYQSQILKATVTAKTSTITLDPAGGTLNLLNESGKVISGSAVAHKWSHFTTQALKISRDGYYFEGWADENGNMVATTLANADRNKAQLAANDSQLTVGAAWYGDTTLTAVWSEIKTVNFWSSNETVTYNGSSQTVNFRVYSDLPANYKFIGLTCSATGTNVNDRWAITFNESENGIRIYNENGIEVTHLYAVGSMTRGTLTVNKAVLNVTAENLTKTYDGNPMEGFVARVDDGLGADPRPSVDITAVTFCGDAVAAVLPGTYTITPVVSGLSAENYTFAAVDGVLTIEQAPLTATLDVVNRPYDGTNVVAEYKITTEGKIGSDQVDICVGSIAFPDADADTYSVTATDLTLVGDQAKYYYLDIDRIVDNNAQITPRPITVWLSPVSRKYDGTTTVDITFGSMEELIPGDRVSVVDIPATGTLTGTKDAGNGKAVTVANTTKLTGRDSGNYTLNCQVHPVDILQRTVILATESAEKLYDGQPLTAVGYSVGGDGFVTGEVSKLHTTGSLVGSNDDKFSCPNEIDYDKGIGYVAENYQIIKYLGTLTVYPDKNGNDKPDTEEDTFNVTYLPTGTNLNGSVVYKDLLPEMPIPAAPKNVLAANNDGYSIDYWQCIDGVPGANDTIGESDLFYQAVLKPRTFAITYELGEKGVNSNTNPTSYTYGVGVKSFTNPSREGYVFAGWEKSQTDAANVPITSIAADAHGDVNLVARWMEDKNKDGTPDDYQVLVTYQVENGTWADDTATDIPVIYNLYEQDENGNWSDLQNITLGERLPTGMKPAAGYIHTSGSWNETIDADTPVPTTAATYTFTFGERQGYNLTVSVQGGTAKVDGKAYESPVPIKHGDGAVVSFTPNEGWILDSAVMVTTEGRVDITLTEGSYTLEDMTRDVTIQVRYSEDNWNDEEDVLNKPDGIPDCRQVVFQFLAGSNGSVTGKTIQVITLPENTDGTYRAERTPEGVTVTPATTFRLEKWEDVGHNAVNPFASRQVVGGNQYVFTAIFHQVYAAVKFLNADKLEKNEPKADQKTVLVDTVIQVNPNGGTWRDSTEVQNITVTEDIDLGIPARAGYLFRGWKCEESISVTRSRSAQQIACTFTAQWLEDGSGGSSGGDGTPDIYQKKVIFRIENGYWSASLFGGTNADIVHYLTLTDANGNWSATGSAELKSLVPTGMKAKWGYHNGKWDVTPPDYVSGTDTVIYTYRYVAKPQMNPKTGDDSGITLWILAMLAAMAAMVCLILTGRRKKKA